MTSQLRHHCFGGHSNFYFLSNSYIFSGKSPNLDELSFSLSELWAKDLKGGAEHPPGQDRVKMHDRWN